MNIFKSLATLAYIVIVISSCEDRSIKGAHRNDNATQVNEVAAVSQPSDSMKGREELIPNQTSSGSTRK